MKEFMPLNRLTGDTVKYQTTVNKLFILTEPSSHYCKIYFTPRNQILGAVHF